MVLFTSGTSDPKSAWQYVSDRDVTVFLGYEMEEKGYKQ
jgi:hypothetical protein